MFYYLTNLLSGIDILRSNLNPSGYNGSPPLKWNIQP